ncbi:histone deacetylase family protein [Bermanella marisrubri]|uniref:Deacetylases, including yeast histone deacetylase and acetoin utilization protein n=1 Tax=Bermanella marisrubri TaxID=207949 RepID=Q1N4R7_9GAMM|nr:histone deacetylase family protein [Bermanella marisrubri]EAT13361.1 Deacetylases, including yeast histone deacetylase and acetoin utilization protein [Oceanobacter sp. RED65] [Bermanella marisrubri]QIZ84116.1 histone deacetylase family protein [Bermanella marisrubri]
MTSTLFIQHSDFDQHSVPPQHPESPLRNLAVETKLRQSGLWNDLSIEQAKPVSREIFQLIHSKGYIDQLYNISPPKGMILADPDTPLAFDTLEATEEAAGSGIQAVESILSGKHQNAFCAIRPPGHHAEPKKTKGFCFVNNIALAAQHALNQAGINRVLIFDFDVHQANGTIEAFRGRDDVVVVTSFQHPYYPNSHWLVKEENIINIPVEEHTGSAEYRRLVENKLLKAADAFKPDMVFISAGFDAHIDDPMGGLDLIEDDYYWLTKLSMDIANRYAKGRIVSMMEGGYNLEALGNSAHEHIRALTGQ